MNQIIIQQIKNFGYNYQDWTSDTLKGLQCHNPQSNDEFNLIFLPSYELIEKGITTLESLHHNLPKYVVFILEVDHHIDEVVEILSKAEEKPHLSYLLFDPEEDIEFFMKDLWNVLILVHHHEQANRT